jgi:hypothetical protein
MNKLKEYVYKNADISDYNKDYDEDENVLFYEGFATIKFNGKNYQTNITHINKNKYSYKNELVEKLINIIIIDLGKQKLEEIYLNQ